MQHHAGAGAFYGMINREKSGLPTKPASLEELMENYQTETKFIQQVVSVRDSGRSAALDTVDPFSATTRDRVDNSVYRQTIHILKSEGENISGDVLEDLRAINLHIRDLQNQIDKLNRQIADLQNHPTATSPQDIARFQAEVSALQAEIDELNAQPNGKHTLAVKLDEAWNHVQEDIHNRTIRPEQRVYFNRLFAVLRAIYADRIKEPKLAQDEAETGISLRDEFGPDKRILSRHASLNLGDARERWTVAHGDSSDKWVPYDGPGEYKNFFSAMEDVYKANASALGDFEPATVKQDLQPQVFTPAIYVDSGAAARMFAVPDLSLMTVADPLPRQTMPADTWPTCTPIASGSRRSRRAVSWPRWRTIQGHWPVATAHGDLPGLGVVGHRQPPGRRVDQADRRRHAPCAPGRCRGAVVALIDRPWVGMWQDFMRVYPRGFMRPIMAQTNMYGVYDFGPYSSAVQRRQVRHGAGGDLRRKAQAGGRAESAG